ncbi:L-ascorbate oxidase [Musa troglodytarum]|uniref:L-ascorbate oxidase n=1 Tax=Musa troglodytarum TaxID=320322 RepID=A0A9E7KLS9_9LILI|nr:L-ascorbate oxidase [Musa troglodytarum]
MSRSSSSSSSSPTRQARRTSEGDEAVERAIAGSPSLICSPYKSHPRRGFRRSSEDELSSPPNRPRRARNWLSSLLSRSMRRGREEGEALLLAPLLVFTALLGLSAVGAEDPYIYFTWKVTYGTISPLGIPQQAILINGDFPGPNINSTSNNNIVVNVFNNLDEPFLFTCALTSCDSGRTIGRPAGVIINGHSGKDSAGKDDPPLFTMEAGKTYRYRICNVGMKVTLNFRIQSHPMKLVEMDGSHTMQNVYESLDVHVGQCLSVLVEATQAPRDYYMVASSRFTKYTLTATGVIRYAGSNTPPSPDLPAAPVGWAWSFNQWRSFRWNLTASAARPNPQGSYHYGSINITRTIKFFNSVGHVNGKRRYALNAVSHQDTATPLKLAEYFGIADKVFKYDIIGDDPPASTAPIEIAPNVMNATFRNFIEIIFENPERSMQAYHLDGYSFFPVGMGHGKWTPESRKNYNLLDTVSRHTIQVYQRSWSAIMLTFDNAGMWNLRSELWERRYLGQQLYISVLSPARSLRDEYNMPNNSLICGDVVNLPRPPSYV